MVEVGFLARKKLGQKKAETEYSRKLVDFVAFNNFNYKLSKLIAIYTNFKDPKINLLWKAQTIKKPYTKD